MDMMELQRLRNRAEAHLAVAQAAMVDDSISDEACLHHLERALACLSDMLRKGAPADDAETADHGRLRAVRHDPVVQPGDM